MMQTDKAQAPVPPAPDFLEHLRQRLGTTRTEAEERLKDWVAEYAERESPASPAQEPR